MKTHPKRWIWACGLLTTLAVAQSTQCPTYAQLAGSQGGTDKGMSNDAQISIVMMNNSTGSWTSDQVQSSQDAIVPWTDLAGSNQDSSSSINAGSTQTDTQLEATGTAANPVVVVEQITPAYASSFCNSVACTVPVEDASGNTTGAIVYISTDITNGTLPPAYQSPGATLTNYLSHEIGVHDDMGWNDCSTAANGSLCNNTDSGPGMYNGTGPQPCDNTRATGCGR